MKHWDNMTTQERIKHAESAVHVRGEEKNLSWPKETSQCWRVETWEGRYMATFKTEHAANSHARQLNKTSWHDCKVYPIFRTS